MPQYLAAKKRTENLIGEKVLKNSEQHVTENCQLRLHYYLTFLTDLPQKHEYHYHRQGTPVSVIL